VLQILTRHIANQTRTIKPDIRRRSVTIPTWSSSDSHDGVWGMDYGVFLFRAASNCSLVMVPLPLGDVPDDDGSVHGGGGAAGFLDVSARMVQAMLDRLYHVSLAKAVSHFGLDADAVKFETRLHDLLNRRHGEEANLADLFNGLLDDSWYSALQSFDGPLVRQFSLLNRKNSSRHRRRGSDRSIGEKSTESNPKSTGARSSRTLFELPRPGQGSLPLRHSATTGSNSLRVKKAVGPALSIDTSCTSYSNNFTQFSPTILSMTERKEKQFVSWDRAKLQRKGYMRNLVVEAIFSLLGFAAERSSATTASASATTTLRDNGGSSANASPFGDDAATDNDDWKDPWAKAGGGDGFYERAREAFIPWSEMVEFLDCVEVLVFQEGAFVAHQGERYPGLCLVVEGQLVASREKPAMNLLDMPSYDDVYTISPGQLFGYGSLQVNNRSMFDVQASTETHVGFLPRTAVQRIATKFPQVMLFMARRLLDAMPPMVALTDFALDWIPSEAGSKIYKRGDRGDSLYFVIKGRCRTTETIPYTGDSVLKEICAGESFGALEIYTSKPRPADVEAVRRSEVVRLRKSSYQALALYHPPLALCLWERIAKSAPEMVEKSMSVSRRPTSSRFRTIAICPLSSEVPVDRVRDFFLNALVDTGICQRDGILECDSNIVIPSVGVPVYSRAGYINLQNYLAHLQENVELLLLTADSATTSTWTDVCIANVRDRPTHRMCVCIFTSGLPLTTRSLSPPPRAGRPDPPRVHERRRPRLHRHGEKD
jgi:CRP-like cAMP-binding protein